MQPSLNGRSYGLGDLPGLEPSLKGALRRFRPGEMGICWVPSTMQMVLPWNDWHRYGWRITGQSVVAIGGSSITTLETVPTDERWWLHYFSMARALGDNTIDTLSAAYGSDYGSTTSMVLLEISTPASGAYWPDDGNQGALDRSVNLAESLVLEPETRIQFTPNGDGTAQTTWDYSLLVSRSSLVRAVAP